nr:hypothetical protein [Tanacetum cinerariifolium]
MPSAPMMASCLACTPLANVMSPDDVSTSTHCSLVSSWTATLCGDTPDLVVDDKLDRLASTFFLQSAVHEHLVHVLTVEHV